SGEPRVRKPGGGFGIGRRQLLEALGERAAELGVDLRFEHEVGALTELDAELVVAADGAGSQLRQELADELAPRIEAGRNRYVWLGTTQLFDTFTFGFARTDAGPLWMHAYAFDPATSTVIVECAPDTWRELGLNTLCGDESLRLLEGVFAEQLDGH